MIHITRGEVPQFLYSEKILAEKEKLRNSFNDPDRQERFHFDISLLKSIKGELMALCNNKCAYCESRLSVSSRGDIENFRPKAGARDLNTKEYAPAHYWWLAYEWENLLIACQICNSKYKRDYFPVATPGKRARINAMGHELLEEGALLIDSSMDRPEEHLKFDEEGQVVPLTIRGKVTIEILGLNREELVEKRKEAAQHLLTNLELVRASEHEATYLKARTVAEIRNLFSAQPRQEYAAIQRETFDTWYEANTDFWENLKAKHADLAKTERHIKNTLKLEESEDVRKVEEKLSGIKRFSIKSIEIQNFKSIDHISLDLLPLNETENRESWLLLLGDNGIGKSSVLQAIALTLAGNKQRDALDLNVLDFLKDGQETGFVCIQGYEHDRPVLLQLTKNGFHSEQQEPLTFVLAYGSTRLLPKGNMQPDPNKLPYLNIRNLFDYSVSLNDANEWLNQISEEEFKNRVCPAFFDVLALKGSDRVLLKDRKISIEQFGSDNSLEKSSDGYKTIVALLADMMQTLSVDSANYHNSQGIVLIDEIGNHLHPRWRMKIAGALRKAFPKLQFIVSTHEPLCLRGLSHGEVVVLMRDQENRVRVLDKQLLPDHNLMRIEQLLTSDLFGLINVMDEDVEKTYEEYYALLSIRDSDKTAEDQARIEDIQKLLIPREILGSTPNEQIFYKLLETITKKIRSDGFKTTEQLKSETVADVKEFLESKNLDWL